MSFKRLVKRKGSQAEWDAIDPIIWEGEVVWAEDTGVFKVGDGVRTWSQLPGVAESGVDEATLARITPDQWNDLRVPFNSVKVGPVNPPDFEKWRDDGAGSTGVFGYAFSPTQLQQVFFDAQLPHTYVEGSRLAPHCHFLPMTTPTVGQTVRFGLEYTYSNVNGVFPVTQTIYATRTFVTGNAQYQQLIGGFDPDIEDPDMNISAMLSCRFFRDATNDTYSGDVLVLEFDFHHLVESFGSVGEFSKS